MVDAQKKVRTQVKLITLKQLADEMLMPSAKKLLESLERHGSGLTVFVDEPSIPMDNNTAERGLRGPIIGRNGYYGSGSVWSSALSAVMFTLVKTMQLYQVNMNTWLLSYLHACSVEGGGAPDYIDDFLPWNMDEELLNRYRKSIKGELKLA